MLLSLLACTSTSLSGRIVDVAGAPVAGAVVTVIGQPCQTIVDLQGHFDLPCGPGEYSVNVGHKGYLSGGVSDYQASEQRAYDLGEIVLVRVPEERGLLVLKQGAYVPMERGWIVRKSGGRGREQFRHYCLPQDPDTRMPVNELQAGQASFFDNRSGGWRPWRLDKQGCAYRMSPTSETRWGVDYGDKAQWTQTQIAPEQLLVVITLEPGDYFVSDWGNGFFEEGPTDDPKATGYGGYLLRVQ